KARRPLYFHQTSYERTRVLRKALRGLLGELVEERLQSLFGHAWSDATLETRLDGPCEVRIERQVNGNENLRTGVKVLTRQHANHDVGFAFKRGGLAPCLGPPAEMLLPEPIGEHDDALGLIARRPVRLGEDSSEEGRDPESVQTAC